MDKGNKPKDGGKEPRDKPVNIIFTASELAELDEWFHAHRFRNRNEAIRELIRRGLEK